MNVDAIMWVSLFILGLAVAGYLLAVLLRPGKVVTAGGLQYCILHHPNSRVGARPGTAAQAFGFVYGAGLLKYQTRQS